MNIEDLDEEIINNIPKWEKTTRNDGGRNFAEAQFSLANVSIKLGYTEEAISLWSNIERRDDAEIFAGAKLNVAHVLHENGQLYEAINEWSQINRSDGSVLYARAQFNIGTTLRSNNKDEKALEVWQKIRRSDDIESYVKAQFSIGVILSENWKVDEAISIWQNIKRSDNCEIYANAKFNIGCALNEKGDTKGALSAWSSIKRTDNKENYAKAKIKIGFLLEKELDHEGAISEWSKIERSDDLEAYAVARSNIGYLSIGDSQTSIKAWSSIKETDDSKIYAHAQFNIGISLINESQDEDILTAKQNFVESSKSYPYESYCYIQICNLLLEKKSMHFGKKLQNFLEEIILITKELTLDVSNLEVNEQDFERKLAHYTGTHTTNILLNTNNEKKVAGSFRLNTINNVNDPSEGKILNSYLSEDGEAFYSPEFDERFQAFISCFTFNHDSLNQFRLYGKKDNQEASGISLVFNRSFFQSKNFIGGVSFLSSLNNTQGLSIKNSQSDKLKVNRVGKLITRKIKTKPVMRCIYIEPISEYVQLAQRNRLTFYREFEDEELSEDMWNEYQKGMDEKTRNIKASLKKLKNIYQDIKTVSKEYLYEYADLIDKTLLPLKYLIKHSAFQEEQECRMIYISSLDSPEVQMDFGSFLYVEYEADVKSHLDKIYIAPAATQYQPYLAKLLCDTDVKIELSNNPYRQT